jgi:hypothetical protein
MLSQGIWKFSLVTILFSSATMALAILNVEAGEKGIFESESLKMK